jgi:protoporphyrinogen oxidase
MEAIPRHLAAALRPGSIRTGAHVVRVGEGSLTLSTGERLSAKSVVVAVEGRFAAELLGESISTAGQGTTCFYFAAPHAPISQPLLVLNGDGRGPINNLCFPTVVAPTYGPAGRCLVSATVLGTSSDPDRLQAEVQAQLVEWFGNAVKDWRHLQTYSIPYALPAQVSPALSVPERPVRWQPGVYVCGDHRDNASIQGAMVSGRRAAEAVLEDLQ